MYRFILLKVFYFYVNFTLKGKPPYSDIHPMRAIFMIPTKPPPTLKDSTKFSANFVDFLSKCLVKNANQRASAAELLQHEFIKTAKRDSMLKTLIDEVIKVKSLRQHELTENGKFAFLVF